MLLYLGGTERCSSDGPEDSLKEEEGKKESKKGKGEMEAKVRRSVRGWYTFTEKGLKVAREGEAVIRGLGVSHLPVEVVGRP